ncbi:MAG: hypothetical protein HKN50_04590 [Gammaproteobacteria bacterium]|nr:hypothetical protein [Gammaproteobacteria bacterium]
MDAGQKSFPGRRRRNTLLTLILGAVIAFTLVLADISFRSTSEWSGWMLVVGCLFLYLYSIRKRWSTLPVGRVAHWLQFHLYLSALVLLLFLFHLDWQLPSGWLGVSLAIVFAGTLISGMLGIYWSRVVPGLLTRLGDEVIYQRIPGIARKLNTQADALIMKSVEETDSVALAEYYENTAHRYFGAPKFQWWRLINSHESQHKSERELETLSRYMRPEEIAFADELRDLIRQKNLLNAHHTLQGLLKNWLLTHVTFSIAVLPLLILHIVVVFGFAAL